MSAEQRPEHTGTRDAVVDEEARILLVDDDQALTRALAVRLRNAGFAVLTCNSAFDASPTVVRERPDLIILDISMPGFSGPEFHQCLKVSRRARSVPIVYLSGHDTVWNRRFAFEHGAVAFLPKPYDAPHLIATVRHALLSNRA